MTTPTVETSLQPRALRRYLPAFGVSAAAMATVWYAAGATLGLFFGGAFVISLMVAPLATGESTLLGRLLAGGAVVDGVGVVWLIAVFTPSLTLVQWLIAYLLLAMYAASLVCLVHLLVQWRVAPLVASTAVMLLAWGWLLWPIWLSPVMSPGLAAVLTPTHPLMALNALLRHLGLWSEQAGTIYHLTNLNQDVPQRLPTTAWPGIVFHALVALGAVLIAGIGRGTDQDKDH